MSNILIFILFFWTLFYTFRHSTFFSISFPDREAPLPSPFFNINSNNLIKDFYDGNISDFETMRNSADFTIVMLYSHWDFRSKHFRSSFLSVAALFKNIYSIKFIAVNCNYYKGRCKSMYKLLAFPVIFALTQYNQPIIFNQILSSDRFYSWIINLLFPLEIINSEEDFYKLISNSEFVVIGHFEIFFNSSQLPRSYNVFVNTAYSFSNKQSSFVFGIILNKTIASIFNISLNQLNLFSLYSNNYSKINKSFLIESTQKTQNVIEWINKLIEIYDEKIVKEIEIEDGESPSKSDVLFKKINSSAYNLILFTDIIGLKQQSYSMILLKNIAKSFNYCPSENNEFLKLFSSKNNLNIFLQKYLTICSIKQPKKILNKNNNCQLNKKQKYLKIFFYSKDLLKCPKNKKNLFLPKKEGKFYLNCQLIKLLKKEKELFKENKKEENNYLIKNNKLIGRNCNLNKTFGFLAIDKKFKNYFIKKWGNNNNEKEFKKEKEDYFFIISKLNEKIYFLKREEEENLLNDASYSSSSSDVVSNFILNFLNSTIKWIPKNEEELLKTATKKENNLIYLNKLNFKLFNEKIIKNKNKSFDSVILFSGGQWHGPSKTVFHIFHQVQNYFNNFRQHIHFYLFDTSKNSLPYAYKFERLPVVGFFPSFYQNDYYNNIFPKELSLTFTNLIGFLLPRFNKLIKWKLAFNICNLSNNCLNNNLENIKLLIKNILKDIFLFKKFNWRKNNLIITKHIRRLRFQKSILLQMQRLLLSATQNINKEEGLDFKKERRKNFLLLLWLLDLNKYLI